MNRLTCIIPGFKPTCQSRKRDEHGRYLMEDDSESDCSSSNSRKPHNKSCDASTAVDHSFDSVHHNASNNLNTLEPDPEHHADNFMMEQQKEAEEMQAAVLPVSSSSSYESNITNNSISSQEGSIRITSKRSGAFQTKRSHPPATTRHSFSPPPGLMMSHSSGNSHTSSYYTEPFSLANSGLPVGATAGAAAAGTFDLEFSDHHSVSGGSSITAASFRSCPNSPFRSSSSNSNSNNWFSKSPVNSNDSNSPTTLTSFSSPSATALSAPSTPTRRTSRLPLTSPLPQYSHHRRSHSASTSTSSLLLPQLTSSQEEPPQLLLPNPCPQVLGTMRLLKSIKQQIKSMKRRESHLSSTLGVSRRERQQMQTQILDMEARRLRVEALFVRPLPLVLLLPVSQRKDEYDLCLVSEGNDAWTALPPLIRIQLVTSVSPSAVSSRMGAMLLHFGPTLTESMAAAVSFVSGTSLTLPHLNLQPLIQHRDPVFWERVTSGGVHGTSPTSSLALSRHHADINSNDQLDKTSCQFLFDALQEHKELWRNQLMHVVDKKTRRIQWILQREANSLYYDAIPSAAPVIVDDDDRMDVSSSSSSEGEDSNSVAG